jgi:hypothetical protein
MDADPVRDTDLATLRRRAYSREGTDRDRARLAELERTPAARAAGPDPGDAPPAGSPAAPPADPADPAPPTAAAAAAGPVRAPLRRRALALLAAALLGAAVAGAVALSIPRSSLEVFGTPAGPDDVSPEVEAMDGVSPTGGTAFGEIRFVGEVPEGRLYAVQAVLIRTGAEAVGTGTTSAVCLMLVPTAPGLDDAGSARRCVSTDEFLRDGISVPSLYDRRSEHVWGPTGRDVRTVSVVE